MDIPKIPDEKIIEIMQHVIDMFLIPKFISLGMNATGSWINALEPRVNNGNGEIWGMDYTQYLSKGRGPNKDQNTKAKINFAVWMAKGNPEFKAWLAVKGLTAYGIPIAYKIADKGNEYYPDGTDLLDVLNSPECKAYIIEQIGTFYTLEISKILKKQIQQTFN